MYIQYNVLATARIVSQDTGREIGTVHGIGISSKEGTIDHVIMIKPGKAALYNIPWNKIFSMGDHEILIKNSKVIKPISEEHRSGAYIVAGAEYWSTVPVYDTNNHEVGTVRSAYIDCSSGQVKKISVQMKGGGQSPFIRASSVITLTEQKIVIRAQQNQKKNSTPGSEGVVQFLSEVDQSLVELINGALSQLQTVEHEISTVAVDDRRAPSRLTAIDRRINAVIQHTNKQMNILNKNVQHEIQGFTEQKEVLDTVAVLNEQIKNAQQLMEVQLRTVDDLLQQRIRTVRNGRETAPYAHAAN